MDSVQSPTATTRISKRIRVLLNYATDRITIVMARQTRFLRTRMETVGLAAKGRLTATIRIPKHIRVLLNYAMDRITIVMAE